MRQDEFCTPWGNTGRRGPHPVHRILVSGSSPPNYGPYPVHMGDQDYSLWEPTIAVKCKLSSQDQYIFIKENVRENRMTRISSDDESDRIG